MNRNNALKKLVLAALFVALDLLFTRVFCVYLMGGAERVSLQTLASAVCGWALGPWWGAGVAAAADLLGSAVGDLRAIVLPGLYPYGGAAGAYLRPAAVPQARDLSPVPGGQCGGQHPVGLAAQCSLALLLYGQKLLGLDSGQSSAQASAGAGLWLSYLSHPPWPAKKRPGKTPVNITTPAPLLTGERRVCFYAGLALCA